MLSGTCWGLLVFAITTLILGNHIWLDFFHSLGRSAQLFDRLGVYPATMYNFKGTLTLWLGSENSVLINRLSLAGFFIAVGGMIGLWYGLTLVNTPVFNLKLALGLAIGMLFNLHTNPHDGLLLILPLFLLASYHYSQKRSTVGVMLLLGCLPACILMMEYVIVDLIPVRGPVLIIVGLIIWLSIELARERKKSS